MNNNHHQSEKETYANSVKNVPEELKERGDWIVVNSSKEPIEPQKWSIEDNRLSFGEALSVLLQKREARYLANLFTEDGRYCGIDIDKVRNPNTGETSLEAHRNIIEPLGSYSEISTSGTGYHIICVGEKLRNRKESAQLKEDGPLEEHPSIEVYDSGQYFIMSGRIIENYDTVTKGRGTLLKIQREYLPKKEAQNANRTSFENKSKNVNANPETIRRTIEEYSKAGHSKADRTLRYWDSTPESTMGKDSPSEADLAFASDLAFWCRADRQLMAECFRVSKRYRSDFDSDNRGKSGMTYGETTIEKAIETVYDTFSGHYVTVE